MNSISINGKKTTFSGKGNISIANGIVTVGGIPVQDLEGLGPQVNIVINGDVENLISEYGDITIHGTTKNVTTKNGNVQCGVVSGNVDTKNGNVSCGNVQGDVNTKNGNISRR